MDHKANAKSKVVATVVGARPQFIKAAAVSRSFQITSKIDEAIIHTGQHYDYAMSEVFFRQLGIPAPHQNLNIGGGTHGQMTGRQIEALEREFGALHPDLVLVYGDTNSTLAAAIAASKMNIPIAHVEAGLRSNNLKMPEEINRKLTDHVATLLFAPTMHARNLLLKEGIPEEKVFVVGDVMKDSCLIFSNAGVCPNDLSEDRSNFVLTTIHRAETLQNVDNVRNIFLAFLRVKQPIIFPAHPNTYKFIVDNNIHIPENVSIIKPVSYFEMLWLLERCSMVCTDSGGLQKEAYFMGKPCITLRNETEWVELLESGWNVLTGYDSEKIINAFTHRFEKLNMPLYGDGDAAKKIMYQIEKFLS